MKNYAIAALAALAMLCSGCSLKNIDTAHALQGIVQGTQALTLSNNDIIGYSQQAVAQMDAQAKVAPANNAYAQRLARITQGLTQANGTPLNFKVYLTNDINAFATADGSVRVYSGIMDLMNDNELLGIIGHEVGHVAMHHSLNAMKQSLTNSALLEILASTSSKAAALSQSQLAAIGNAYLSSKFSRQQENEADDFGYEFLKGAGKNPWAMVDAFEKMEQIEAKSAGANSQVHSYLSSMFSDHPATAERIRRMTQRAQKDNIKRN